MSDKCFDNIRRSGGLGHLTVVIFAPDSEFDRIIILGLEGCEVVTGSPRACLPDIKLLSIERVIQRRLNFQPGERCC